MGQIVGQPIGGLLSHPERNIPFFDTPFWNKYPFALPCFISAGFAVFALIFGALVIEEVRKVHTTVSLLLTVYVARLRLACDGGERVQNTLVQLPKNQGAGNPLLNVFLYSTKSVSDHLCGLYLHLMSSLLMSRVSRWQSLPKLFSLCKSDSSIVLMRSKYICCRYPLFAFTPIASGGLGLSEAKIGAHMASRSFVSILVMFFYTPLERRLGVLRMYSFSMFFFPVCVLFFPVLNAMARAGLEGTWLFDGTVVLFFTTWSVGNFGWSMSTLASEVRMAS